MRQGRGCRCKRNAGRRDMETGSCMKARVGCVPERDVNIAALRVAGAELALKAGRGSQPTGKYNSHSTTKKWGFRRKPRQQAEIRLSSLRTRGQMPMPGDEQNVSAAANHERYGLFSFLF
jgi:hypothetical protein